MKKSQERSVRKKPGISGAEIVCTFLSGRVHKTPPYALYHTVRRKNDSYMKFHRNLTGTPFKIHQSKMFHKFTSEFSIKVRKSEI